MTRAIVLDSGLASKLGRNVFVVKRKKDRGGKLVYYPNNFAVLQEDETLLPIREGDIVKLRVGSGIGRAESHYRTHIYLGKHWKDI